MNRKFIFVSIVLVGLALITTGCRLPASGSPPVVNTPVPGTSTSTTAVQVIPTNTSLPPTPVIVTSTSIPPTPAPPTPVPPTPTSVVPTAVPLPQASRIQFVVGGTSAIVNGELDAGQTIYYVLGASSSQTLNLKVSSQNADVFLGVFGADRTELLNPSTQDNVWSGRLPSTQDYYISLTATGGRTSYTLSVEIPPLQGGPTPNLTPQPGTFDPVATYGNPKFSDKMDGDNIDDWTNPVTGLLPDTSFIRIEETDKKFYVTGKQAGFSTWYFTWHELDDFYLQATFDSGSCSGMDAYGLIIRGPEHLAGKAFGYIVAFSCDGQYWVWRLDSADPWSAKDLISWTHSDFIIAGPDKQNVLGIKAVGDKLTIYANGHQIGEVTDSTYKSGRYGVFVSPEITANYTYRVVQMSYWDLSK